MEASDYRNIIRCMMGDYRYTHSVNVAEEAVFLAKRYGCDEQKAYIAGILHDITKEIPHEEQLQIIRDGGIILDDVQQNAPKLWHSISGSVYIKTKLDITDSSRKSLEEAMIFSCQFTLRNLSEKEAAIHPDQLFCYNDLVLNRKGK